MFVVYELAFCQFPRKINYFWDFGKIYCLRVPMQTNATSHEVLFQCNPSRSFNATPHEVLCISIEHELNRILCGFGPLTFNRLLRKLNQWYFVGKKLSLQSSLPFKRHCAMNHCANKMAFFSWLNPQVWFVKYNCN